MLLRTKIAIFNTILFITFLSVVQAKEITQVILTKDMEFFFSLLFVSSVFYSFSWVVAFLCLNPLYNVIEEIKQLDIHDKDARLRPRINNDAVKWLKDQFNALLDKIQNIVTDQKMFIANVSHELKNPLSTILNQIDVTLSLPRKESFYVSILESIREETKDMSGVTSGLLQLARIKADASSIDMQMIRIDDLLWNCKKNMLKRHPEYNITYDVLNLPEDDSTLSIKANEELLSIAITNVIDNACKFSSDKTAKVTLDYNHKGFEISISDSGPGISSHDQSKLFDHFFRSPSTSDIGGSGIGLPLAKSILDLHKIPFKIVSDPKGTMICLSIVT